MNFDVEKFQASLLKISGWVDQNKILQAIKNAFIRTIPFTVVGSFANLIKMELDALIKSKHLHNFFLTGISNLFRNSNFRNCCHYCCFIIILFICS